MKQLLAPLHKLASLMEAQIQEVSEIKSFITVDLKAAAKDQLAEMKKQTSLLRDIREVLKDQLDTSREKKDARGYKDITMAGAFKGAGALIVMGGIILAAGMMLSVMPVISPSQFATAIAIAMLFVILTPVFVMIVNQFQRSGTRMLADYAIGNKMASTYSGVAKMGGVVLLMMVGMAAAVVTSGFIMTLMPTSISMAQLSLALAMAFIMIPLGYAIGGFVVQMKRAALKITDPATIAMVLTLPIIITGIALGIVAAAYIFMALPSNDNYKMPPIGWIFGLTVVIAILGGVFAYLSRQLRRTPLKDIAIAALLALPLLATSLVLTAWILKAMPDEHRYVDPIWAASVGLAMLIFSFSFIRIVKAIHDNNLRLPDLAMGLAGMVFLGLSILAVSWIFKLMPEKYGDGPPLMWILTVSLTLLAFSMVFVIFAFLMDKLKISNKAIGKALLGIIGVSIALIAVAFLFQALGDITYGNLPSKEWAIAAAIVLGVMMIPIAAIGVIIKAVGIQTALYGIAGVILVAAALLVVAWIFTLLPDLSSISKNFTDAIMYPVNAIIDAFVRLKTEIGVENMLPLAGGVLALAGSWLAFVAALAGSSIGSVVGAAANLGKTLFDGISKFFGGDESETPISILEKLVSMREGIALLGNPIKVIADNFPSIAQNANAVVTGISGVLRLAQTDVRRELEKSAAAISSIKDSYQGISDASRTMNVEAINATTKMFDAIRKLAEADGEDTIKLITTQLLGAVKELSQTVEALKEANQQNSNSIKDALTNTLSTLKDWVVGANGKGEGEDDGPIIDIQPIVLAIQDLEERLNKPILVSEV